MYHVCGVCQFVPYGIFVMDSSTLHEHTHFECHQERLIRQNNIQPHSCIMSFSCCSDKSNYIVCNTVCVILYVFIIWYDMRGDASAARYTSIHASSNRTYFLAPLCSIQPENTTIPSIHVSFNVVYLDIILFEHIKWVSVVCGKYVCVAECLHVRCTYFPPVLDGYAFEQPTQTTMNVRKKRWSTA